MKTNIYSKLSVLFTLIYIIIGQLILHGIYIPLIVYLGAMTIAVCMGVFGLIRSHKSGERPMWLFVLLTVFNVAILSLNMIVLIEPGTYGIMKAFLSA